MQKTIKFYLILMTGLLVMSSFAVTDSPAGMKLKMPKKIDAIVQSKCYGCHNSNAKFDKPKQKLNFDELSTLSPDKQLEKMKDFASVVEEGSMPPSRFLENNPDKNLTDDEVAKLKKWTSKAVKKLSK